MKQQDIAKKVGISGAFLSEIIHGKKSPSWKTAKNLNKITGVPIDLWMENKSRHSEIRDLIKQKKARSTGIDRA